MVRQHGIACRAVVKERIMGVELMTIEEAAERIGLSPRSLRRLLDEGRAAVHRIGPRGGRVRFSPEDLDAYVRSTRQYGPWREPSPKPPKRRYPGRSVPRG